MTRKFPARRLTPLALSVLLLPVALTAGCHAARVVSAHPAVAPSGEVGTGIGAPSSGSDLTASDLNPAMSESQKQAVLRRKRSE